MPKNKKKGDAKSPERSKEGEKKITDQINIPIKELEELQNKKEPAKTKQSENEVILKNLRLNEKMLVNKIKELKKEINETGDISYINLPNERINNSVQNNRIKELNYVLKESEDKLTEIKRQIKEVQDKTEFLPNKNQNRFTKNMNINNQNNIKVSIDKVHMLEQNEMRLMEIGRKFRKKQKEIKEYEERAQKEKMQFLKEQREKEREIVSKRKSLVEAEKQSIKKQEKQAPKEKEYLFYKMEQNYQQNEKNLLQKVTNEHKFKNIFYKQNSDIENIKNDLQNVKNQLQQRALEQTNNMKKLWQSRSVLLKKYETNRVKTAQKTSNDNEEKEEEKKMKSEKAKILFEKKINYSKKIILPSIGEKINKIQFIRDLQGDERIKFIRDSDENLKKRKIEIKINLNKVFPNIKIRKNKIIKNKKRNSALPSENNLSRNKNKNIPRNNKSFSSADKVIKTVKPNKINYLEELKNDKKKIFHKWNKYIVNNKASKYDLEGMLMINKKIESIDEKINMSDELMKVKGGYNKNIEQRDKISNLLIDSMKGKIRLIKELSK